MCIRDRAGEMLLQADLTAEKIRDLILKYKSQPELVAKFEQNLEKLQRPGGAGTIVALSLIHISEPTRPY